MHSSWRCPKFIDHVTISLYKFLPPWNPNPGTLGFGWEATPTPINGTGSAVAKIGGNIPDNPNSSALLAQRFLPTNSAGRILFQFNLARDPSSDDNAQLTGWICSETSIALGKSISGGIGQIPTHDTRGDFSMGFTGYDVPGLKGVSIPFSVLPKGVVVGDTLPRFIEFEIEGIIDQNRYYWVVLGVQNPTGSSNPSNFIYAAYTTQASPQNQYAMIAHTNLNGIAPSWLAVPGSGAAGNDQLQCNFRTQIALTSAGGNQEGTGNKLTVFDPNTRKGYGFTSLSGNPGNDQKVAVVDFATAAIVRRDGFGRTVFAVNCSAGSDSPAPAGRMDYSLQISYRQ